VHQIYLILLAKFDNRMDTVIIASFILDDLKLKTVEEV